MEFDAYLHMKKVEESAAPHAGKVGHFFSFNF